MREVLDDYIIIIIISLTDCNIERAGICFFMFFWWAVYIVPTKWQANEQQGEGGLHQSVGV